MSSVTESIVREAKEIEAYKLGILKSGETLAETALNLPTQQVASLSDSERRAIGRTGQAGGIGGYQGLAQSGRDTLGTGLGTMGQALGALSYAPGYMDASASALGRSEQSLGQSTGLYGGGPGYESQGFNAQQGPAAVNYTADQYQAGPGYTAASFDPNSASQYFNPYENAAVQQALADIRRQGDITGNQQNAAAVQAGAFGGNRQWLQSAELGRNVLEQQGRTAADMRHTGFQNAMQQAQGDFADQQRRAQAESQFGTQFGQQAFEDAQRREQAQGQFDSNYGQQTFQNWQVAQQQAFEDQQRREQGQVQFDTQAGQLAFEDQQRRMQAAGAQQHGIASLYNSLANTQSTLAGQYGTIAQGQANIGVQQLNAAQQAQTQGLGEIQSMQQAGEILRQQEQAALNADFANQQRQIYEPQTRLSWLSDIYKGAPSSTSAVGSQVSALPPTPSIFQQAAGLGTGLIGAAAATKQAGSLF
jgi:hypothetical protein